MVPKTGSRVQTVRFQGSVFVVGMSEGHLCSHDPFFGTNTESSIWRQNDHAKFVGAFHLSRRVSDENRACSISIRFFKITDPFDGTSFLMCSHHPFFGTNKNWILKNGSCERALMKEINERWDCQQEMIPNHFCVILDKTSFSEAKLLGFYGKISKTSQ